MKRLNKKGNIAVFLCIMLTALLGFTAFVVDIGMVYIERAKLSNALDSAALAAVLELPNDDTKATNTAIDYLQKNNIDPNDASITISPDHKSIGISGAETVKHLFAPIIGINNSTVDAKTKAIIGPLKSISEGIRPFAVQRYNFSYGYEVILKQDAGGGYQGNFGVVALGGSGSSVFRSNALYGYDGKISVGDYIDTEPGDMTGTTNDIKNYISSDTSTFDNFSRDSIRLWTIPIVDSMQVNGRNQLLVTGFGEFFIEDVSKKSGQMQLTGRFIRYVLNGELDTTIQDSGAYGSKLSN